MPTVTLVQNAQANADGINLMTLQPMNVNLTGLTGGPAQFGCTNAFGAIQGAREAQITYDAAHGGGHENIQVSSVIA